MADGSKAAVTAVREIIGFTPMGRPIYLISGGDGTEGGSGGAGAGGSGGGQGDPGAGGTATGGTTTTTDGGTAATTEPTVDEKDPAKLLDLVHKLRPFEDQARKLQSQLDQTNTKLKELQDAQLSDGEKLQKRAAELESENATLKLEIQQTRMRSAFGQAGQKAGARVPGDVWKLVDLAEVEFDTDGSVKNADKLVAKLRQASPEHFLANAGRGTADGGARPGAPAGPDMNSFIRRAAGRPA